MLIRVPGLTDGGREITALTEHLDLMPTLVDLANLPPMRSCPAADGSMGLCTQGISLLPLLTGTAARVRNVSISLWSHPGVGAPRCVDGKPAVDAAGIPLVRGRVGRPAVPELDGLLGGTRNRRTVY